jgi:outer membrane receptor for ferrienterochelin and colicins
MKKTVLLLATILGILQVAAQTNIKFIVKDSESKTPLAGASVSIKNIRTVVTDAYGIAEITNIPDGKVEVTFTYSGYTQQTETFTFPLAAAIEIFMTAEETDMEEVVIQSTRTSRSIANTPTRVETIDGEEIEEKNNMRPANVSMLLHESTGLQVQQTSATSANASIRVQGLDGRYTQLLKDGYPNFGNFASGLSILEIPPLDLKQVEVIKGPASTLYGGGAIAGVINFISKMPKEKAEYNFLLNQSNIGQTNIGGYGAQKKGKWGYTVLALVNFQKAYDVDDDHFSELPKSNSFTINPRLFYYPDASTTIMLGNSFTKSDNKGGDMFVIKKQADNNHVYFEENKTTRNTTTLEIDKKWGDRKSIKLKQSFSIFDRKISIPAYIFSGANYNSFTDASFLFRKNKHTVISGINFIADHFKQREHTGNEDLTGKSFTAGIYVQDTWDITNRIKMESGVRIDHVRYSNAVYRNDQTFLLPRISALFKLSNKVSSRIGGGLGYKVPTIFTEQTESMQYQHLLATGGITAEKSIGGTVDVNFKTALSPELQFSINQLFFFTAINKPLVLIPTGFGDNFFLNLTQPVHSKGFETNVKLIFRERFKLFAGYTFIDAKAKYFSGNQFLPLLPKNKINLALLYEKENDIKIGLEGYFTDRQFLYNGYQTPSFWEFGAMAEKTFKKVTLFINFENFTDERQSKYKPVVNAPYTNPAFDDIWNHTEGFVINGGIKIKM